MEKTIHIKTFNTTTPSGLKRAVAFEKKNPNWKLLTSRLEFTWYYELEERDGKAFSKKLNKWIDIKNFNI